MKRFPRRLSLPLSLLLVSLPLGVVAEEPAEEVPEGPRHRGSLTFAPILALDLELEDGSSLLMVELTYEHRLTPDVSLAAIAALGRYRTPGLDSVRLYEAGLQGRYYLLGDFDHGLNVGMHALFLGASAARGDVSAVARGLQLGPALGYKVAARFGLTFDAQLGAAYLIAAGRAESSASGASASSKESGLVPLLRLNLGWSF